MQRGYNNNRHVILGCGVGLCNRKKKILGQLPLFLRISDKKAVEVRMVRLWRGVW